jgi:DNA-directed RNA polymerase specialized sigma24 family protein
LTTNEPDVWNIVVPALDPLERRALALIYLNGLTQDQVAQRLGTQRRTIGIAVARAMRTIAVALEGTDVAEASQRRSDHEVRD